MSAPLPKLDSRPQPRIVRKVPKQTLTWSLGNPTQNAFLESCNGRRREGVLNETREAQVSGRIKARSWTFYTTEFLIDTFHTYCCHKISSVGGAYFAA